ncbi:PDR/VanB family oxidoreductase [Pseudomonas mangiferae]|uniref:Oxidoreductase n=1 Tax=Pseudomonas mangiferae TaxID=2593654 RepID=A0A553H0C9_9PSED|nr:PDR/VanB family oxidoreductase [Pseudomonas mangiferae]TRX75173.1 oxidoreductase [Pseudomonas mangiferae]
MASSNLSSVRLTAIEYGAPGVNHYRFSSLDGQPLPAYEPGAHIDLELAPGLVRQYSLLWPSPRASDYLIAVQVSEAGKGGSRQLHYESVVGAVYRVSAPRNLFPLQASGISYLFAGGIGITPIVSMYRQLRRQGRAVQLFYWSATPEHALFAEELQDGVDGVRLFHTRSGVAVPRLKDIVRDAPAEACLYCCGPTAMIDEFDRVTAGRAPATVHRERFSASTDALQPGDGFQVTLQRSGMTLSVGPDQTLLQVCEAAGVDVAYSCEEGVCGACEVRVLGGEIEHRDTVLSPQQRARGDCMMICCSRGIGASLVLDL